MAHCNSFVAFIGYEGYPVIHLPVNVPDVDQKAKQSAFLTYVQHDKQVRDLLSESASTLYDSWLARQYRVDQPRSLIAHCRGLTWRGRHRASSLALVAYAKIRPALVHLPLFGTFQNMFQNMVTRRNR